jgi:hypothetical protein
MGLRELLLLTQTPYSDIEGLTHLEYFRALKSRGVDRLVLGIGADLVFGGTPYEYPALARDLLFKLRLLDSYRTFTAYLTGISGHVSRSRIIFKFIIFSIMTIIRELLPDSIRTFLRSALRKKSSQANFLLNNPRLVASPKPVMNYSDALSFAYGDSSPRQLSQILRGLEINPIFPFEGKRFGNLAAECDPVIFSRYENKYCIRFATRELLPKEILKNKKKFGNAGFEGELFTKNKYEILSYIRTARATKKTSIVNIPELEEALTQDIFTDNVFRAINLLLFEDIVREHKIELSFCEN